MTMSSRAKRNSARPCWVAPLVAKIERVSLAAAEQLQSNHQVLMAPALAQADDSVVVHATASTADGQPVW
jgi:hypothetical protein